jgi:hypothetical protein
MSAMQPATPQELEAKAAPGGANAFLGRFDLSSAIYGSLLITTLVAAQARHDANPEFIGFSVLVSVLVFWLMEVWSGLVSLRVQGPITMAETREVAVHDSPMLAAAILPVIALATWRLQIADVDQAVALALIVSVAQLFLWGLVVGRALDKGWPVAFVVAIGDSLLGLVIVVLKVLVIH